MSYKINLALIDGFPSKKASTNVYEVIDTNKIKVKSNILII